MAVTVIDGQHGNPDFFRGMPVACEGNDVGVVWVQGRARQNGSMQFDFRKEFFFESFHQHQIKRLQIEFWQQFLQRGFARVFWQFRNQGMAPAVPRPHGAVHSRSVSNEPSRENSEMAGFVSSRSG